MVTWRSHRPADYTLMARVFHWLTAVVVLGLFALGLWMVDLNYYHAWYQTAPAWHMGVGFFLAIFVAFRLLYRISIPYPAPVASHSRLIKRISQSAHWILYVLMFAMFLSGYLSATADGDGLPVFQWFVVPSVYSGTDKLEDVAGEVHEIVAFVLIGLASLHALGALKHHFFDRDATLVRMIKPTKPDESLSKTH